MKRPLRHCSLLRVWFSHRSSRSRPRERGVGKQRTRLPAAPTAGSWKSSSAWRRRRSGWTRSSASLRAVQQQEERLPAKAAVHQARVTARKLRASLRILRVRELDPAVKELQDALGRVRDLQLQVAWLRERDAALFQSHKRKLRTAERALDRALQQWNSRTVPALLQASEDARQPPPRKLSKILRKRLERLEERLEAARKRPTTKALHRADVRMALIKDRPELLRAEREARQRLAKVVDAQLARWHGQKVAERAQKLL